MSEQSKIDAERVKFNDYLNEVVETKHYGMQTIKLQRHDEYTVDDEKIAWDAWQARASLPVGVPDGLIDELRNHAAARTGYTTDLIGRAADAIEKILEPTAGRWASYKEKYCGCKDASRLNRCRGLDNCELPCRHPDRNTAAPAAPTVKESLSVAPTVKAEQPCPACDGAGELHHPHAADEYRCESCDGTGSVEEASSLPAAGSAGAPFGEVEIPDIVATFDGLYLVPIKPLQAGEHLMAVAQCIRIQEQLRAALSAQQSAPERVSVPVELLERASGFIAAFPSGKALARELRALLNGGGV